MMKDLNYCFKCNLVLITCFSSASSTDVNSSIPNPFLVMVVSKTRCLGKSGLSQADSSKEFLFIGIP